MGTSKLLVLGVAMLAFAAASPAGAEELDTAASAETAPATETGWEGAEVAPLPKAPAEPWVAEPAPAAEALEAVAEVPAPALEAADTPPLEAVEPPPAAMGEPAEPVVAAPADAPAEAGAEVAALPPESRVELGAVGYDAEGRPGRIHLVVPGDTLWDISDAYLGTPWVWPSIWQDNQAIENPHLIYPGDRIWITPWEMRRITAKEAEALLAGQPAAPDEAAPVPEPVIEPPPPLVAAEQLTYFVSDREMVGLLSDEVAESATSVVGIAGLRVLLGQEDRVYIGLGRGQTAPGDQFTIFRLQEKIYDPDTRRMLGHHVHMLGWLEVMEVGDETSLAVIRESSIDIVVGDRVMPRLAPVQEIAIQPSPDVEGRIAFFPMHRELAGMLQYVFLNRGTLDGVEVGSPLVVYRKGYDTRDAVRKETVRVDDRVVADLLVVKAEAEASVALVRHTEEELSLGDHFRGIPR
jgi:hypothetical protein